MKSQKKPAKWKDHTWELIHNCSLYIQGLLYFKKKKINTTVNKNNNDSHKQNTKHSVTKIREYISLQLCQVQKQAGFWKLL